MNSKAGMRRRKISSRVMSAIMPYHSATYTTWIPQATFQKAAGATINPDAAIIDTMQEFMDAFGNSNTGHRYQPLSMAAERLGYNWTSAPHGSLSDTLATLAAQKCVDDHKRATDGMSIDDFNSALSRIRNDVDKLRLKSKRASSELLHLNESIAAESIRMETVLKAADFNRLDKTKVSMLIESVYVHKRDPKSGTQAIDITWKF